MASSSCNKDHNQADEGGQNPAIYSAKEQKEEHLITATDWYTLSDDEMKLCLDHITVPENTRILDVIISHFLKFNKYNEDTAQMKQSLALDTCDYVLAAINDREDEAKEGGTHWSLLLYIRDNNTYYHLDSVEPLNGRHAQKLAATLSGDPNVSVVQLKCRQQDSNVECGAYVIHYSQLICSLIMNNINIEGNRCFGQNFSINKIYETVQHLKRMKNLRAEQTNQLKKSKLNIKLKSVKKVTLLSDSHGRNLRHLLQSELGDKYEVYSVVKPNAKLEDVVSDLDYEASKLNHNDCLIILSGTNNVDLGTKLNIKSYVQKIADKTKNTNVILCTIPLRYDRPRLNSLIRKVNIELVRESLKFNNVEVVSTANISVNNYTYHGLHLNNRGKKHLCKVMAKKMYELALNK